MIDEGAWSTWSGDSRWLYYSESSPARSTGSFRLMKAPIDGGAAVVVRTDNARGPAVAPDGSALYYVVPLQNLNGSLDYELRAARPPEGESTLLARISGERIPNWQGFHPVISRDGKWLATPLNDNLGTNLWVASTSDGKLGASLTSVKGALSSPGEFPGARMRSGCSPPSAKGTPTS